jgi:putative methionine-R-sulfoxide reductase with GAF domain
MLNLSKYRQLSVVAVIIMALALVFSFIALWNSLLTSDAKHEGWVILCLLLVFIPGVFTFVLAYKASDAGMVEKVRIQAYESGKTDILREIEKRNAESTEVKKAETAIESQVALVLDALKGARNEVTLSNKLLAALAKQLEFVQGILYLKDHENDVYMPKGTFALTGKNATPFKKGENLNGQVAESRKMMVVYDIPENYFEVASGLGTSKPRFLLVVPIISGNDCLGVMELAAFKKPDENTSKILNRLSAELGNSFTKFIVAS